MVGCLVGFMSSERERPSRHADQGRDQGKQKKQHSSNKANNITQVRLSTNISSILNISKHVNKINRIPKCHRGHDGGRHRGPPLAAIQLL